MKTVKQKGKIYLHSLRKLKKNVKIAVAHRTGKDTNRPIVVRMTQWIKYLSFQKSRT